MTNNSVDESSKKLPGNPVLSEEMEKMLDDIMKEILAEEKREKDDPVYHMQREHERAAKNGIRIDLTEEDFIKFAVIRKEYPINSVVEIFPHVQEYLGDIIPKEGTKGVIQGFRIVVPHASPSACGQPFSKPTMLVCVSFELPFEETSGDVWLNDDDENGKDTLLFFFETKLIKIIEKAELHTSLCYMNGESLVDANIFTERKCVTDDGVEFDGVLAYADFPMVDYYSKYPTPSKHISSLGYVALDLRRRKNVRYELVVAARFGQYESRDYLYMEKRFLESTGPADIEILNQFVDYRVRELK